MKKVIKVKQEHINNGDPKNSARCPIALAIIEQLSATHVDVELDYVSFDEEVCAKLPLKAQKFILNFDDGKEVKPFEFTIKF